MAERVSTTADVIIIGAGLSGLMAANVLQDAGLRVTVLDKGRSVGGRLASRRIGPGLADHGAQFFTVRHDEFGKYVERWLREGLVFEWSRGFSDGSLISNIGDGHPRYAVKGGMNALAKRVAENLKDVRVNIKIATATADAQGWILQDEEGEIYTSDALIMTAPVPQTLEILDAGATMLNDSDFEALARITYAECLCGLFWVEGRVTLPAPGAVQRRNANVIWVSDNKEKGVSPEARLITLQTSEQYSRQMWRSPDDRILASLRTELSIFMEEGAVIREAQLKRWRYSRPLVLYPERHMSVETSAPLICAGDAFGGARVEGALLSGLSAGQAMVELVKR